MVRVTPPAPTARFIEVGEPTPAPATRVAGRAGFGNAIKLGGESPNQYVSMPPGILRGLTDFTIATWVNLETSADWARIFDFGTGTQVNMFLAPRTSDASTNNAVRFSITNGGGGAEQRIIGTAPLPTGWTHVAVSKSGNTGTLYVNGEAVGTNPNLTLSPSDLAGGDTPNNWIGRSQYPDPLLDATVDDFQVYNRALAPAELLSLMNAPGTGNVVSYRFDETGGTTVTDSSAGRRDGTVTTRIVGVEQLPAPDGFASADRRTGTVRVVFGGGAGDLQLKVGGLATLGRFGKRADVRIFTAEWTGTDGVSEGPRLLFEGTYPVEDGRISVPLSGLDDTAVYLAVVEPDRHGGHSGGPQRRYEAEAADHRSRQIRSHPLASDNRYVTVDRRALTFRVNAPVSGAYDLDLRYTNPTGSVATAVVTIGRQRHTVELPPTAGAAFGTARIQVVAHRGGNTLTVQARTDRIGVDYVDLTPFRTRVEAESGQWTGANLVRIDMAESNFFAPYVSNNAYVGDLSQPDSALRLPVTVPAAGTYRLKIGYSTAGTEAERRAQIQAHHFLRIGDGPWRQVSYDPTQFRQMIRQTSVVVDLPAGTSTITLAKSRPDNPGQPLPGVVDVDYIDVALHR
jgi:hypothetical protein